MTSLDAQGLSPAASLVDLLKPLKWVCAGLLIFSLFLALLMFTGPLYMLQVYDRVLASGSLPTLTALTLLVLVLYAGLGILEWVRAGIFSTVASGVEYGLASRVLDISLRESVRDPGRSQGAPLQHLANIRRFIASPALPSFFDAPWTPLFLLALFLMHWVYGAWACFGATVLIISAVSNQIVNRNRIELSDTTSRKAQMIAEEINQNVEVVDALGMRQRMTAIWRVSLEEADAYTAKSQSAGAAFVSGTKAFRLFLQSAILGLGAWLSIKGESSPGTMIAASILLGRAISPVEQTVGQWRSVVLAARSWRRLNEALAAHPLPQERMRLPPLAGKLEVEALSAAPHGAVQPFLRGLNFNLAPGQTLGVIGPSAAGKTMLAKVLVGVWEPMTGSVRLDGAELGAWGMEDLGPQIGFLPQTVSLFGGTVRQNISRFNDVAEPAQVIEAAMAAGCHDMILQLPEAYDTQIGIGGAYLSAGQRQRIGLARALFGNPKFVVLDEPNSNLDTFGEVALHQALVKLKARLATTVIVSHRPAILSVCDHILMLDEGAQRLFGPRESVMAKLAKMRRTGSSSPETVEA